MSGEDEEAVRVASVILIGRLVDGLRAASDLSEEAFKARMARTGRLDEFLVLCAALEEREHLRTEGVPTKTQVAP